MSWGGSVQQSCGIQKVVRALECHHGEDGDLFSPWRRDIATVRNQSTVTRVAAIVPFTSAIGVPVPKTSEASKILKSKVPL